MVFGLFLSRLVIYNSNDCVFSVSLAMTHRPSSKYFSTKRVEELKGYFDDVDNDVEYTRILRHTPTRWLSMKPCINRILKYWDPLCRYFKDHPDVGKVKSIRRILDDPSTKPILCFLVDVLTPINAYNQKFQVKQYKMSRCYDIAAGNNLGFFMFH